MRRLVTLGTPVAFALMSLAHPRPGPTAAATLAPQVGLWIAVHVAQLVLIPLTGLAVWLLIEDLPGLAPAVSRCALVFFVAFYAAFDALVGIGTGILLRQASGLTGADGQLAMRIAQGFWDGRLDPSGPILWVTVIGDLAWIVALLAAALAQRRAGASRLGVILLAIAGIAFAIDHTWPAGTIGMAALCASAHLLSPHPGVRP